MFPPPPPRLSLVRFTLTVPSLPPGSPGTHTSWCPPTTCAGLDHPAEAVQTERLKAAKLEVVLFN